MSAPAKAARLRTAVVLFNLGGPDSLKAVRPFLFNLFRDPAIITLPAPARLALAALISTTRRKEASANYAYMGGSSPLLRETEAQARALELDLARRLPHREVKAFIAMRYWRPLTGQAARAVAAFKPDEVVLTPLYPQFSTTTTGSSMAAWRKAYKGGGRVSAACCYFAEPGFVAAHVQRILETYEAAGRPANIRLLFSAHGLPERVIQGGDPYQWQVERTCEAVAKAIVADGRWPELDWQVCYQSRVGPLKWIGPSTPEAVQASGREGKGVLVTPIAFVSEHVETLVELDRDYAAVGRAAGCPVYLRAPALGVSETFIQGLGRLVVQTAARADEAIVPEGPACDPCWGRCPHRQTVGGLA